MEILSGVATPSAEAVTLPRPTWPVSLPLVVVPVSDVDRAKTFYADQVGFEVDHDTRVSEEMRFVQLTPRGSAAGAREAGDSNGAGLSAITTGKSSAISV